MEGIDADLSVGEVLFSNRNKAASHVAAEVFDLSAFFRRKLVEIPVYGRAGVLFQDINDGVDIAVGDATLIFAEPPFMVFGTPDTAVSFEFIDVDGFREFPRGRPKRTVSKTDWTMDGVTQFCRAIAEKERGSVRSRRMES